MTDPQVTFYMYATSRAIRFKVEMARALASRRMSVEHAYSPQYVSGKATLSTHLGDPIGLSFRPIEIDHSFEKYSPVGRFRFVLEYTKAWIAHVRANGSCIVIVCNVPLLTMIRFARHARRSNASFVLWHQDIACLALIDELSCKLRRVPFGPI